MAAGTIVATGGWVGAVFGFEAFGALAFFGVAAFLGELGAWAAGAAAVSVMARELLWTKVESE